MVTPESVEGATARALGPFETVADAVAGLLLLTDFPDCVSRLLGLPVVFDATTGFFVAGAALTGAALTGVAFAGACLATGLAIFAGAFFAAATGRFAFATALAGALCALPALTRATGFARAGALDFFALLAAAGLLFAIVYVHTVTRRPRVIA